MSNNLETRRFEYNDEKSSKFWEIQIKGNGFNVRYGKIGTDGQKQSKDFADTTSAEKQAQKLIAEKLGKGYLEVGKDQISTTAPSTDKESQLLASLQKLREPSSDIALIIDQLMNRTPNILEGHLQKDLVDILILKSSLEIFNWLDLIRDYLIANSLAYQDQSNNENETDVLVRIHALSTKASRYWLWETEELDFSDINRCQSMEGGPFFSSSEFPWPSGDKGPWLPVIQLDLGMLSILREISVGSGLIQVWWNLDWFGPEFRLIPAINVKPESLAEVPSLWVDQLIDTTSSTCKQIVGISKDAAGYDFCDVWEVEDAMQFLPLDIVVILRVIEYFAKPLQSDYENHLFGSFKPIQYDASEKPNMLFSLEEDTSLDCAVQGSLQMFYELDEHMQIRLSVDSACG
ncbi:MAG: WGR domain-containing protein [Azonexus sp.]|nr:WGR domain-containing protein [Azonexus sp.]